MAKAKSHFVGRDPEAGRLPFLALCLCSKYFNTYANLVFRHRRSPKFGWILTTASPPKA